MEIFRVNICIMVFLIQKKTGHIVRNVDGMIIKKAIACFHDKKET